MNGPVHDGNFSLLELVKRVGTNDKIPISVLTVSCGQNESRRNEDCPAQTFILHNSIVREPAPRSYLSSNNQGSLIVQGVTRTIISNWITKVILLGWFFRMYTKQSTPQQTGKIMASWFLTESVWSLRREFLDPVSFSDRTEVDARSIAVVARQAHFEMDEIIVALLSWSVV